MRVPNIPPIFAIAAFLLAIAWTNSRAHEGEDHDEPKQVPAVVSVAPRTEAASEKIRIGRNRTQRNAGDLSRPPAHQ